MDYYYFKILCFFRKRVVLYFIFLLSLAYFLLQFNAYQLIRFVSFFVLMKTLSQISLLLQKYSNEDFKTTVNSKRLCTRETRL